MKRNLAMPVVAAMFCIASCETDETPEPVPSIKVETSYEASYEAAEHKIAYVIENPSEESVPDVSTQADWIENLVANQGEIVFGVTENIANSDRTAEIVLCYANAENVMITVTQKHREFTDLSVSETANCYIVSQIGTYGFRPVKGNSQEPVGEMSTVEVLWESFGTDVAPETGDLVSNAQIFGEYILFSTPDTYSEGNAVIAAKDADGNILWSWHIWLTDVPEDQEYLNNAGTMMDRNLGATSATPGDPGALGLMYQWGRKDPFLGSAFISEPVEALSTIEWPEIVQNDETTGTIEYSVAHPTTFIASNKNNSDWYYSVDKTTDDTRWQSEKTIYDPCPAGYRIPDGGEDGIWFKAFETPYFKGQFDETNKGFDFGADADMLQPKCLTDAPNCWYPAPGLKDSQNGGLFTVGSGGTVWACNVRMQFAYNFDYSIVFNGVSPTNSTLRGSGRSVRCMKIM